jgi:hypothetical protein
MIERGVVVERAVQELKRNGDCWGCSDENMVMPVMCKN